MRKFLSFTFASLLVLAFCTFTAMAQSTTTGAISISVTDPNGAVVPNATITARNLATNKEETATANDEGQAKIVNLQPGTYSVVVKATGFGDFTQGSVVVEVGTTNSIEAKMGLTAQEAQVNVTAEAPVLNTSQQDFSTNVNQTQISELPINGARWSNFALLSPGTVPDGNFGLISFRGISGLLNNNTVDGGDNNQAFFSEERGRTRINYVISQRAIREFQVNTSNYSAEYGRAAGGVTNAVTKSGSNQFHGDVFFYDRDNRLGARNPLAFISSINNGVLSRDGIKPKDRRYTFGGDIGGPIKKDKAFFFFNYDEVRRDFPGLAIFSGPAYLLTTNLCATGNSTEINGPANANTGVRVPCSATLLGQSLKSASRNLSDAQINSVLNFLNSETGPNVRKGNQRIFMPKVDVNLNANNTLTVTYNYFRWDSPNGIQTQPTNTNGRATFGDDFVDDDSVNVRLSSNISPTLINEARYQWSRDFEYEFSTEPIAGEPKTAPAYPGVFAAGTRVPDVFLTNGLEFGTQTFLERPQYPNEKKNQVFDMLTWTKGKHTLKFGADFSHVKDTADNLRTYAGSYSYNNINDFIIDYLNYTTTGGITTPCSTSTRTAGKCYTSPYAQAFGGTAFTFTENLWNFFAQDDWRVHPRLTLNMGLRWEYQQFPDTFLGNPAVTQTNVKVSDKTNFGPRVGFAWDATGDGKTSLRGGYGVYYGLMGTSTIYNTLVNTAMPGGQFAVSISQGSASPVFPNTFASLPSTVSAPAIQFFQQGFKLPRIHQADMIVEREIAKNTVVSASLLLSYGQRLPLFVDTNLSPAPRLFQYTLSGGPYDGQQYTVPWFYGVSGTQSCTINGVTLNITSARPNKCLGQMTEIRSVVWSKYVGGVFQFNRRLTNGLQFGVNYTRSTAKDAGQSSQTFTTGNNTFNAFDTGAEAGTSFLDVPNKFVANVVWQPQSKNPFLKDWTFAPILQYYTGVPIFNAGGNPSVSATIPLPGASQAPGCFSGSTQLCALQGGSSQNGSNGSSRFALAPKNSFRLPSIWNVDMRVSRRIRFDESRALEFLIEGFNVFNRTQVTGANAQIYTSTGAPARVDGTAAVAGSATLVYNTSFQTVNAAGGTLFRERQVQWAVRFQF
ncbi:MAG TPA: TonB-dependent receptor [Pyrinomonadaceae bacterium]|jgi:carboxypeptidase family protein/TonB-dependent receptor-like protein|nr:TonB-dependent receptor [Pyrinomonadaceae bacterium]